MKKLMKIFYKNYLSENISINFDRERNTKDGTF